MVASEQVQEAGRRVAGRVGDEIYLLLPEEGSRYFLAEGALIGVGGVLLAAFLRGVSAQAQEHFEAWGSRVGDWLLDRIEKVVTAEDPVAVGCAETDQALLASRTAPASVDEVARGQVTQVIVVVLTDHGVSADRASAAIAEAAAQAARLSI